MRQRVEIVFKAIERMKKWKSLTISILSQFRIRLTNIYFKWNTMLNIDSIYFFFLHCLQHTHTHTTHDASFRFSRWKHKNTCVYINHNRNFSDNYVNRQSFPYACQLFCWMNILLKRIMQIINANEIVLIIKVYSFAVCNKSFEKEKKKNTHIPARKIVAEKKWCANWGKWCCYMVAACRSGCTMLQSYSIFFFW